MVFISWLFFISCLPRFSANIVAAIVIALIAATAEPSESEQDENEELDSMTRALAGFVSNGQAPSEDDKEVSPKSGDIH